MVELAIGVFQHIVVAATLDAEVHVHGVEDIEVNPATHVDAEIPVLIGERVVP